MNKIFHLLFLSCLKASELIEKRNYFRLGAIERFQLMVHKIMCEPCAIYERQSALLDKVISRGKGNNQRKKDGLELLKKQIIAKLKVEEG